MGQARSLQRATEAQTSLEREAAEREKTETKARKQLERVHLQLAEFVYPVQANSGAVSTLVFGAVPQLTVPFGKVFEFAVTRCGLEDYAATYCLEFVEYCLYAATYCQRYRRSRTSLYY